MKAKALVKDGKVLQIELNEFPVHPSFEWVDVQEDVQIGWIYEDGQFYPPPALPEHVELGILSTDVWVIPADSETVATVTYTDTDTVYFSVNETVHAVDPIDYVATLEITADALGPIRVEVKSKQLIITAIEVPL